MRLEKNILIVLVLFILLIGISMPNLIGAKQQNNKKVQQQVLDKIKSADEVRVIVLLNGSENSIRANDNKNLRLQIANEVESKINRGKIRHRYISNNAFSATLSKKEISNLANDENVLGIYYDVPVKANLQDSVPLINGTKTWALQQNSLNLTGAGQTICIIDTGVNYTHKDLGGCLLGKYSLNGTNESLVVQSEHDYSNNFNGIWNISMTGYSNISVHFVNISLEYQGQVAGYDSTDRVIIYDGQMREIASYHGINGIIQDLWTPYSSGNTTYVRLVTDSSVTSYGFYIDQVRNGTTNTTYDWSNCSKVIGGWDFVNNDGDPMDDYGHGTHVTGIAAANGSINGVAPQAKIISAKALNGSGEGWESDIDYAIDYCINISQQYNISVISMSLGGGLNSTYCDSSYPTTSSLVNIAVSKNISVVVSAGNDGLSSQVSYPACLENVTAVSSTTKSDAISSFSNRYSLMKLLAPGGASTGEGSCTAAVSDANRICATSYNGAYVSMSGTSMAAPHVAGAIAIIRQYLQLAGQSRTPKEIETVLANTGKKITDSNGKNYSRIDIYNAVSTPLVTLTSPNNNIITNRNQSFICNVTSLASLKNISFYLWNSTSLENTTFVNITGIVNGTIVYNNFTHEDNYTWSCLAVNNLSIQAFASDNNSIIYDLTPPVLNITSPFNSGWYNAVRINISLNENGSCIYSLNNGSNNASMQANGSRTFYAINSSFSQGSTCNATLYCNDSAGNVNSSYIGNFSIDLTSPNITIIAPYPADETASSASKTFYHNMSDNLNISSCSLILNGAISLTNDSISNKSLTHIFSKSLSAAAYSWSINCTDIAGNQGNSSTRTFTITAPSGGTSGGGGGGATTSTYSVSESQLSQGYTQDLGRNDRIKFSLSNENHTLTTTIITTNLVNITIQSTPMKLGLYIGQSLKLNLTSAEFYVLSIKLESIINGKAKLTLKEINESIQPRIVVNKSGNETYAGLNITNSTVNNQKSKANALFEHLEYLFGAGLVIIIALIILLAVKIRKKRKIEDSYKGMMKVN